VASIKTHGVIHPLVVCPADDNGAWRLIDGERRYRACPEAGVTEVPVIVRTVDEDAEALDVALVANMERVELTVLEQAKAFQRLLEKGLTRKGVAERVGVSAKLVRDRLQILELPVELHAKVGDATIAPRGRSRRSPSSPRSIPGWRSWRCGGCSNSPPTPTPGTTR